MTESENQTRKRRIDAKLKRLGWELIPYHSSLATANFGNHAVEEFPTPSGPADYALFVNGQLLGIIEAKKVSTGVENVMEQAKRYAKAVPDSIGSWRGYQVPFLYSTNGETIFTWDARHEKNLPREILDFHLPQALWDRHQQDQAAAFQFFHKVPVPMGPEDRIRDYQVEAIRAVEQGLEDGRRKMLVAMATGTGKTFTTISLIYRLLKSGYAKRILFLVDRRALAAQTVAAISAFETRDGHKLDREYEVYSQKFQKEDFDEGEARFDSKELPKEYLTNPSANHTYILVSTIQRLALSVLGQGAATGGEDEGGGEYQPDVQKLDIPIHAFDIVIADECHRGYSAREAATWKATLDHFDAVKIGLTATPAAHTLALFEHMAFQYSTEKAIEKGFLVDYDAIRIKSEVKVSGAFLKPGERVDLVDTQTGTKQMDLLEDERAFDASDIERTITLPQSTRKIIEEVKKYADAHQTEYGRFPKTLIFAVNDMPHRSHADEVVRACKQVFGQGDDFVVKITGSPSVDRPLQKIRQFRNRPEPKVVVTVDMLSTGVDIPALEFIVFLRMVKSRILWVQMLGRGTRLCKEIHKEKFTVFDCFDGTLIEYFKDATDIDAALETETTPLPELVERIFRNEDRDHNVQRLIKRLRRVERTMSGEAIEKFAGFIPEGNLSWFLDQLPKALKSDAPATFKLLRNPAFQKLLVDYPRPKPVFYVAPETGDSVVSEPLFRYGDTAKKPKDYLELFTQFVRDNPDRIQAIEILLNRPKEWKVEPLEELRAKLRSHDFGETDVRRAHDLVYGKPLVDIISMVKHAADAQHPLFSEQERVDKALKKLMGNHAFTGPQLEWLGYIRTHLEKNMALSEEDFRIIPVFTQHGGLFKARKVFGAQLTEIIENLNEALAA